MDTTAKKPTGRPRKAIHTVIKRYALLKQLCEKHGVNLSVKKIYTTGIAPITNVYCHICREEEPTVTVTISPKELP